MRNSIYFRQQEAAVHLKHSLDLKPDFEPALAALKDIENIPEATVHVYTLLIIVCLVDIFILILSYQVFLNKHIAMVVSNEFLHINYLLSRSFQNTLDFFFLIYIVIHACMGRAA